MTYCKRTHVTIHFFTFVTNFQTWPKERAHMLQSKHLHRLFSIATGIYNLCQCKNLSHRESNDPLKVKHSASGNIKETFSTYAYADTCTPAGIRTYPHHAAESGRSSLSLSQRRRFVSEYHCHNDLLLSFTNHRWSGKVGVDFGPLFHGIFWNSIHRAHWSRDCKDDAKGIARAVGHEERLARARPGASRCFSSTRSPVYSYKPWKLSQ